MPKSFPWEKIEKGQGFFVPALDLKEMQEAGLRAAVAAKVIDAHAYAALHKGMLGVYFYRDTKHIKSGRL